MSFPCEEEKKTLRHVLVIHSITVWNGKLYVKAFPFYRKKNEVQENVLKGENGISVCDLHKKLPCVGRRFLNSHNITQIKRIQSKGSWDFQIFVLIAGRLRSGNTILSQLIVYTKTKLRFYKVPHKLRVKEDLSLCGQSSQTDNCS